MRKRKYTVDNDLRQLKKKYTEFRKHRQDFRGFVYFLHRNDNRTLVELGEQIGYSKAGIRKIVLSVEKELQQGGETT